VGRKSRQRDDQGGGSLEIDDLRKTDVQPQNAFGRYTPRRGAGNLEEEFQRRDRNIALRGEGERMTLEASGKREIRKKPYSQKNMRTTIRRNQWTDGYHG